MATTTADYQKLVAHHLAALGRDDIGVGEVREVDDTLQIEFVKGTMREEGSIPLRVLNDPERARAALSGALLALTTAVERRHIEKAMARPEDKIRTKIQCPVCSAEFETEEERDKHTRREHGEHPADQAP